MFRVRKEQLAVFSALSRARFEAELAAQLRAQFPRECQKLGDQALAESVAHSIDQGKNYGFTSEQQVCGFAGLVVLLGRGFEEKFAFAWAARMLNDPSYHFADQRLEALYAELERRQPDEDDEEGDGDEAQIPLARRPAITPVRQEVG